MMKVPVILCFVVIVTANALTKNWEADHKEILERTQLKDVTCKFLDCLYWYFQYGYLVLGETMKPQTDKDLGTESYALAFFYENEGVRIIKIKEAFQLCLNFRYNNKSKCESFFTDMMEKGYPVPEIMGFCMRYLTSCTFLRKYIVIPYDIEKPYLRLQSLYFHMCWFRVRTLEDLVLTDSMELSKMVSAMRQSQNNACTCELAHALGNLYRNLKSDSEQITLGSFLGSHCIKSDTREITLYFRPTYIDRLSLTIRNYVAPENNRLLLASLILKEERNIAKVIQRSEHQWQIEPFILTLVNSYQLAPVHFPSIINIVNTAINYGYDFLTFILFSDISNYTCSESTETLEPNDKIELIEYQLKFRKEVLVQTDKEIMFLRHFVKLQHDRFQQLCKQKLLRSSQQPGK